MYFLNIYMCVFLFILNKYTEYADIYIYITYICKKKSSFESTNIYIYMYVLDIKMFNNYFKLIKHC